MGYEVMSYDVMIVTTFTPTGILGKCSTSNAGPGQFLILDMNTYMSARNCTLYLTTSTVSCPSVNQPLEAFVAVNPKYRSWRLCQGERWVSL